MNGWFVKPVVDRLPLSGGQWIDVKRRLNVGEENDVFDRLAKGGMILGERISVDPTLVNIARYVEYLVGWSLTDDDGKPVPLPDTPHGKTALIRNMDSDRYQEIRDAIDAHQTAVEADRVARKNAQAGVSESLTISPSPDASTGGTSGLVN